MTARAVALVDSYAYCRRIARRRAKNFYYSFLLLPSEKRDSMCALYGFMRCCDDLSDEPGASRHAMDQWRSALNRALAGDCDAHPCLPAFADTVARYRIPHQYFFDMIEGVTSDLEPQRIQTFDELYRYCYRVASVVGLSIIHIFGFDDIRALNLAEKCGIAFQLTNIIRDVREDAARDRVYLPAEDLARFGVPEIELNSDHPGPRFVELMRFEILRAREYYNQSRPLLDLVHRSSRSSLWALIEIYSRLLAKIERRGYDVLSTRVALSPIEKASVVFEGLLLQP